MMGGEWGYGWGGMGLGWLIMIGFVILIVFLAVWAMNQSSHASRGSDTGSRSAPSDSVQRESALDILQARYARGEISKDEYMEARATLNAH